MKRKILSLLFALLLLIQTLASAAWASDLEDTILEGTPGIRGLTAQQSLSGPDTADFDGESILLYEMTTGTMAYAKNIDQQREPAALTKVMTCLLALKHGNLEDKVTVTQNALSTTDPEASSADLIAGEVYTLEELLYMLMVRSANDAAAVIAEHISGSQGMFVEMMNVEAVELGCENTHFSNPHGLHAEDHFTTARDMAMIMEAALAYPLFGTLYAATSYQAPATEQQEARSYYSPNYLMTDDITQGYLDSRVIGGATGFTTPAGRCVACVAEYESLRYLVVVLGASNQQDENEEPIYTNLRTASALLDYGCQSFAAREVLTADTVLTAIPVNYGDSDVTPVTVNGISALLPTDYNAELLRTEVSLPDGRLVAPIAQGSEIGTADIYYDSFLLGSVQLTASNAVALRNTDSTLENPEDEESASHRAMRLTVTVIASVIGGCALILLLLMLRASLIRSLRKRRRKRLRAQKNTQSRRRQ